MKAFRYAVDLDEDTGRWYVYKFSATEDGICIGYLTDLDTINLLMQAPAMRQMHDAQKKFAQPATALTKREYSRRTLRDFAHAFAEYFRKL